MSAEETIATGYRHFSLKLLGLVWGVLPIGHPFRPSCTFVIPKNQNRYSPGGFTFRFGAASSSAVDAV